MSERSYRVIVRGVFTDLDAGQRTELATTAAEHDLHTATFTDAGTLVYDRSLRAFSVRCVVRPAADTAPAAEEEAAIRAGCDRATGMLAELGLRHGPLRAAATSIDDIKVRARR